MSAIRITLALVALSGLAACAGKPAMEPAAPAIPSPSAQLVPLSEAPAVPVLPEADLAMEACRTLTIINEVVDFSAPADAAPRFETRRIVAEYPHTPSEKARGMQHRTDPDPEQAMLFEFSGDHNPALWMKDTPASLDMIFIAADGQPFYIELETTPFSEQFLTPEEPEPFAKYVLEVPAGGAERLGIVPGLTRMEIGAPQSCLSYIPIT